MKVGRLSASAKTSTLSARMLWRGGRPASVAFTDTRYTLRSSWSRTAFVLIIPVIGSMVKTLYPSESRSNINASTGCISLDPFRGSWTKERERERDTFENRVGDGRVLAEVGVQSPHPRHFRARWLLLPHADHVPLRIHDFGRVVVHVEDRDLEGHPGRPRRSSLIPGLEHELVHPLRFPVQRFFRDDLA